MSIVEENIARFHEAKTEEELFSLLEILYEKGYRYITRKQGSEYITCFSFKPQWYREGWWGYRPRDINKPDALMAYPIKTELFSGIKSAILISDIIEPKKEPDEQITLF